MYQYKIDLLFDFILILTWHITIWINASLNNNLHLYFIFWYLFCFRSPNELPYYEEKLTPLPSGALRELTMILKELRVITDKIKNDEDSASIENDWKFAAMVLDRLCLITFTLFTMMATAALLITAPHVIVT